MKVLKTITVCLIYLVAFTSCSPFTNTVTSEPTPTIEESQKLVQDLLENNAGCRLPCWWGITPGETTWDEARQILVKVSSYVPQTVEDNYLFNVSVHAYLPYSYDFAKYMEHSYRVDDDIVVYIQAYNFHLAPKYSLPNLLNSYGKPSEVWIRTFPQEDMGFQHFLIDVFYEDLGILVEYGTGHPLEEVNGNIQNCSIDEMDSPFLYLWSPDNRHLSFQEAKTLFLDTMNLPEPKPLFKATGMDVNTFFETFKNPKENTCIETPKELWK